EAAGKGLQLPHGRRFPDIEEAEEGQGGQVALPVQGAGAGEGDPQAHDFVHDDDLGVLEAGDLGGDGGGPGGGDEEHGGEDEEVPAGEAGELVKENADGESCQRTGGAGSGRGIAAAEPGGELEGEGLPLHGSVHSTQRRRERRDKRRENQELSTKYCLAFLCASSAFSASLR